MIIRRAIEVLIGEFSTLRPRLVLVMCLASLLPPSTGGRLRAFLLRLAGFQIGSGVSFSSNPRLFGEGPINQRLSIGANCWLNVDCAFELGANITIGERVSIGPQTMMLTTSHDIGPAEHRCGPKVCQPIVIERGSWIGARCIILPGVTIGSGSVVAAGAVVNRDVPAHSVVAGVPARVIRSLDAARVPHQEKSTKDTLPRIPPSITASF